MFEPPTNLLTAGKVVNRHTAYIDSFFDASRNRYDLMRLADMNCGIGIAMTGAERGNNDNRPGCLPHIPAGGV
jgi:hypothetical protein